ncbi:hypothetical protein BHE74_00020118 [Ensete ventricosum]|nr:hypothetical protein BHE74_00020118 [Ensete ventricosum]
MKTKRLWLNHLGTHCPYSQGGGWKEQSKLPPDFPTPHSTQLGLGSSSKSRRNGFLKAPTPMRTWFEERDRGCYYRFHRNYDHDTKECYNLKNQIEDLIRVATLPVTFSDEPRTKTLMVPFMVVELPPTDNVIIGRSTLNKLRTVVLTYYRIIKFLISTGAVEVRTIRRS